jgi:cold shock CspA family protein
MRLSGTLKTWHDDRGFGFIAPSGGNSDVFLHISELPRDGTRPTVGEKLSYELGRGKNGKPQAVNVIRLALGDTRHRMHVPRPRRTPSSSGFSKAIALLLLLALGVYGYRHYEKTVARYATEAATAPEDAPYQAASRAESQAASPAPSAATVSTPAPALHAPAQGFASTAFACDGRTHCSQMTSCAEAKFFLQHCPNTKMDGDNDGTPCEQQWCTEAFAK